ncbi:MAG: hypothetical protein V7K48_16700 [Nostoc sp.]|uniref:hypothetical protein n=1 Tax=Nostoc sp. TaxID=1180 RepID=UPI002FF951DE
MGIGNWSTRDAFGGRSHRTSSEAGAHTAIAKTNSFKALFYAQITLQLDFWVRSHPFPQKRDRTLLFSYWSLVICRLS